MFCGPVLFWLILGIFALSPQLQKLFAVLDELENLKPLVRQLDQPDNASTTSQMHQIDGQKLIPDASTGSLLPALNNKPFLSYENKRVLSMTIFASA